MRRYLEKYLRGKRTIQWRKRRKKRKRERKGRRKEKEKQKGGRVRESKRRKKKKGTALTFAISSEPAVETRRGKRQSWST